VTEAVSGVTATLATGTAVTVTLAVPDCPSLVAVIVTDPGATPVTNPALDTVATPTSELAQVTVRPASAAPPASRGVTDSCVVPPTVTEAVSGVTATLATGTAVTVTLAVPNCPSLVAVTVADPGATPVTSPALDTVATPVSELLHVTTRPVRVAPLADRGAAVNCVLEPTTTELVAGVTWTEATGAAVTVMGAVAVLPSTIAWMNDDPSPTAVTVPSLETLATDGLPELHVTLRPVRGSPAGPMGVAVMGALAPTVSVSSEGDSRTCSTRTTSTDVPSEQAETHPSRIRIRSAGERRRRADGAGIGTTKVGFDILIMCPTPLTIKSQ
jgi:hypothetical protein